MKYILFIVISLISLFSHAQSIYDVTLLRHQNMSKWKVKGANYSGITRIDEDNYLLVSDKETIDGFYPFTIRLDSQTAKVKEIIPSEIVGLPSTDGSTSKRDQEDIAFNPFRKTIVISGEGDQRIIEYSPKGVPTGRELQVPSSLGLESIQPNYGFEALTFSTSDQLYWTITEHTLRADGNKSDFKNPVPCLLRLQSFTSDMRPSRQFAYRTDAPTCRKQPSNYAFGVPAITALEDGSLLVMEREFFVAKKYIGSWVKVKIFHVRPLSSIPISFTTSLPSLSNEQYLEKELVAEFSTKLNLTSRSLANYEGMCLGPTLSDGRRTLILVSDSQGNYGNSLYKMKDFIKVITFRYDWNE